MHFRETPQDKDDDLIVGDEPDAHAPRASGKQEQITPESLFRGPLTTIVVAAISVLVTIAISNSCGSCVRLGTWTPPYQSIEEAAAEKKNNAEEHDGIRKDLKESVTAIRSEITTGNQAVLKAIANQQREPPKRPR